MIRHILQRLIANCVHQGQGANRRRRWSEQIVARLEQRALMYAFTGNFVDPNPSVGFGLQMLELSTGNVVVLDPYDNAGGTEAGAVYLYNGTTGELISTLTGSHAYDRIGYNESQGAFSVNGYRSIREVGNGNFVVMSPDWDSDYSFDVGAVTWGSGITGVSGVVSAENSLVGSSNRDHIGYTYGSFDYGLYEGKITILPNGNYVISNPFWNNSAGMAAWGDGNSGVTGVVGEANSLIGTHDGDVIGTNVDVLPGGNYLVRSRFWDNGAAQNAGMVAWGSGTSGVKGVVSAENSLVGSSTNDAVGDRFNLVILENGNYTVQSPHWDNGDITNAGAVTWGSGTTGVKGVITSSNSLVGGRVNDNVGSSIANSAGVVRLNNGNYVVRSANWDNGDIVDAGAVTWADGSVGVTGFIDSTNSLVGSSNDDAVGEQAIIALRSGNYVVWNTEWDNGSAINAGAVT